MTRLIKRKTLPSVDVLRDKYQYDERTGFLSHRSGRRQGRRAGSLKRDGYRYITIFGQSYLEARICWKIARGVDPEYMDHINGIRDDNRLSNLRSVSHAENNRNAKVRKDNVSGIPGVTPRDGKWAVHITHRGKEHYIGRFSDLAQAEHARRTVERIAGYHENHGRT